MDQDKHAPRLFADEAQIRAIGEAFCACALPREAWTHEAHLSTCLWLIRERPEIVPESTLPAMIRTFNESVGGINDETQGYHETITQGSIIGVRRFLARNRNEQSLLLLVNGLLQAPEGRRDWLLGFYSKDRLFSVAARLGFVEPDLQSLSVAG